MLLHTRYYRNKGPNPQLENDDLSTSGKELCFCSSATWLVNFRYPNCATSLVTL